MFDEGLGTQVPHVLGPPDLRDMVWTDAEDGVVRVEGILAIRGVGAVRGVEQIDVVNRVHRSLEPERVEVGETRDEVLAAKPCEQDGPHRPCANEEGPHEARFSMREPWIGGVGGDVADRCARARWPGVRRSGRCEASRQHPPSRRRAGGTPDPGARTRGPPCDRRRTSGPSLTRPPAPTRPQRPGSARCPRVPALARCSGLDRT